MDLELSMERAAISRDHVTLKRLPSARDVQRAKDRLEKQPRSEERKEAINLLLEHGWDVNQPLGVNDEPILR
jgi:hypothetical protein